MCRTRGLAPKMSSVLRLFMLILCDKYIEPGSALISPRYSISFLTLLRPKKDECLVSFILVLLCMLVLLRLGFFLFELSRFFSPPGFYSGCGQHCSKTYALLVFLALLGHVDSSLLFLSNGVLEIFFLHGFLIL